MVSSSYGGTISLVLVAIVFYGSHLFVANLLWHDVFFFLKFVEIEKKDYICMDICLQKQYIVSDN